MPIFDFRCEKCYNIYEEFVLDDVSVSCPSCNISTHQTKLVSSPAGLRGLPFGDRKTKSIGKKK